MAVELARAYMSIVPSMRGFQGAVSQELAGVGKAGETAGRGLGESMSGGIRGRLLSALPGAGTGVGNLMGGSLLGAVRKYAAPVAGVVAGLVSVEAVKKSMEIFEQTAASTRTLQRTIGGTAQSVSGFVGAMQLSGVQSDKAGTALRIFSKNVGNAGGDSKKAAKLNAELGFSFQDAHGKILPMSDLLPKVADKFQKMPDGAQKTALAMQLFGKSGTEMLPFLNKGSAGIAALTVQATKMGLVLDDTSINIFAASRKSARDFGAALQGVGVSAGQDFTVALDGIVNIGRSALIPVFGAMSRVFVALRPQFIAIGEAADGVAAKLGAQLAPIVNRLAGEFIAFVQKAPIGKWAEEAAAAIGRVVSAIGGLSGGGIVSSIGGIAAGFSPLRAILEAIRPILPQIVSALGQAATTVGPLLAGLATQVVAFLTPLITSRAGILLLVGAFVGFRVVTGIIAAIALAARIAAAAQVAWNIAMSANPIGIIILAVAALVVGLIWFFTQTKLGQQIWTGFVNFLKAAWTGLVAVAQAVWAAIVGAITQRVALIRTVVTAIVNAVVAVWSTGWRNLTTVVRTVFSAVVAVISTVINTVRTVVQTGVLLVVGLWILAWRGLVILLRPVLAPVVAVVSGVIGTIRSVISAAMGFISGVWRAGWNVISGAARAAWSVISAAISAGISVVRSVISAGVAFITGVWRADWNVISGVARAVWSVISGAVSAGIGAVRSVVSAAMSFISGIWSSTWNAVVSVVSGIWSRIVGVVSGGVSNVIGVVSRIGGQVLSAVGNFGSLLFNAGRSLIQGFINGIASMVGAVGNIAKQAMDVAASFFPHSPAKEGPFSGKGWTLYSGQAVAQSFAEGMTGGKQHVRAAANDLMSSAAIHTQPHVAVSAGLATASINGGSGGVFVGNLYLDSGEFLGKVRGEVQTGISRYDHSKGVAAMGGGAR